jgi:hypothetical protein
VKVGDLVWSVAFEGQNGIITKYQYTNVAWFQVVWLRVNRNHSLSRNPWSPADHTEWCRSHEIEVRDIL